MKKILFYFLLTFISIPVWAQPNLPSPAQFLGYPIGTKFTPHHRIVAYVEQLARQAPNRLKLIPYGSTFEGRPLVAVAVASETNLARLEEIRTNNLKRIGLLDGPPTSSAQPPIAWLSYNVHGNEAVSSEAFMEVLYGLLQANDAVSRKILSTTVVLLDPGLNPDGHDRYVNWYNQMVGRNPDPRPFAREHQEPWPGGRYTHYIFDPNRDWAWQTQEVTQQRMALYQQWMPQLHGDFHEMGPESPYYFAPSAKPYHEDITPWQRQFQDIIGQYNTRYFDRNNWLYYTRERFDLFYPSYGDTWPTYNGAIGMTFEQGGGGRAGLAFEKNDGDTLTLRQRIDHHVTASFATLESVADRPDQLVKEFVSYFDKSRSNPVGAFKSYVIKSSDEGRMKALRQLLDRNQIRYGYAGKSLTAPGFNYTSQKNEKSITVAPEDLVISAYQPKSTLLKILFEPTTKLEDSVTYDITAWSLPYAFGVGTYGLTSRIDPVTVQPKLAAAVKPSVSKPYAYVARWQSLPSAQLLAALMKQKIRVRAAEKEFEANGQTYPAGTLIISRAGNERLGDRFDTIVQQEANQIGITITPIQSGFVTRGSDFGSGSVLSLKTPRVGIVTGDGVGPTDAGEVWYYFDQELNYPATLIDGQALGNVDWRKLDVLIMPSGSYARTLTDRTLSAIKDWVRSGGKLIALERAAEFLAGKTDFELKEKEDKDTPRGKTAATAGKKTNPADSLKTYGERERNSISDETIGSIYRVNLDTSHPLAFGLTNGYYAMVQNAYNFDFLKNGWNVGYLKDNNYVAGFSGSNAREKLKNTLIMGVQEMGKGTVVYLADDPLFRGFWYNGKLMFANAVFMTGN